MWLLMRIVLPERAELAEQLAQLDAGPRVEARRRLVEEQDLGIVDEGVGEAQPLLHAARQGLDVLVALVAEVDELEEVADHPSPPGGRDPVAAGEEVEVLPDLHVVVDPEDVRHEAEDAPDLVGVPGDGEAGDLGLAARRPQQRGEDAQRGRLAGAVGPDQAEDLAGLDGQVDAGDGQRAVVALDEALGANDRGHSTVPVIERSNWKPIPSLRSLTNRTRTRAGGRVDVPRRVGDRVAAAAGQVRQADPVALRPGRRARPRAGRPGRRHAVRRRRVRAGCRDRGERLDRLGRDRDLRRVAAEVEAERELGRRQRAVERDRLVRDGRLAAPDADARTGPC